MCKIGDIILVNKYNDNGKSLNRHSFVVISDEHGKIEGLSYDLICNVLSSFKNEEQKKRKMGYVGNFPISSDDTVTTPHNDKSGYLKTDQLYYFNKSILDYEVIGYIKSDILELVFDYINESNFDLQAITSNLDDTLKDTD
jgi:hypothetical protein